MIQKTKGKPDTKKTDKMGQKAKSQPRLKKLNKVQTKSLKVKIKKCKNQNPKAVYRRNRGNERTRGRAET